MQAKAPVVRRLDRLFEWQAERTPSAVALLNADGNTTYAELDAMASRIAGALRDTGVQPQSVVGVHLDRSRNYVAAALGALKAGAAVIPLPPTYPSERLREILAFAGLAAVIDGAASRLDADLHPHILDVAQAAAARAWRAIPKEADSGHPAFILCSSGSTGVPKMIVRSHGSFFHRLEWTWRTHPFAPGEVCCQKAHMTTTHAVYELFEPLLRGIPVCIIADPQVRALESFWAIIRQQAITRLLIVPSMLQASLDMPDFVAPNLRVLTLMGEAVYPSLAARALAAFPSTSIQSIYGSTEASSTLVCDLRSSFREGQDLPLGDPISLDIHAHVLDENLQALADGSPGMLYLSGPALFSGYFRNAALSDAAFVTRDGERLYRTNDRVMRAEGALHYLGRSDHVVKTRGFRVDVQEVENALVSAPGVRQCAVVAKYGSDGDAALVAFLAPETVQTSDVYRALRETLPDYMLPSRIIKAATLPLTPNGKIDRRKLLEDCDRQDETTSLSHYASNTERRVAEAWRSALGHANFDRDSNFFEAGGSSLKTFAVIAQLRSVFGLGRGRLPDDVVYRFPTIRQLAACVDGAGSGNAAIEGQPVLVTLKAARDKREPLFVIASAGGTLGAYERVVRALRTTREVIGVRDPFLWSGRDPTSGFRKWIGIYLDAIRARQPNGPYHLLGYSSAGAFACEIARRLRSAGAKVALLALIDPLAMDRSSKRRFGYWALQARFERPAYGRLLKAAGGFRAALRAWPSRRKGTTEDFALDQQQFLEFRKRTLENRQHILQLSALLELNTGLPLALTRQELDRLTPTEYFDALLARLRANVPDVEADTIERLAVQYQLQVRAQNHYRLQRLGCTVALFEPEGPDCGLLAAQLRAYVAKLQAIRVPRSTPAGRSRELADCFPAPLQSHYLCMRDDAFAQNVARQLDWFLDHPEPSLSRHTTE